MSFARCARPSTSFRSYTWLPPIATKKNKNGTCSCLVSTQIRAKIRKKSLVCKMYETVNKQVKFLISQCIGTCKNAYTKGYDLN